MTIQNIPIKKGILIFNFMLVNIAIDHEAEVAVAPEIENVAAEAKAEVKREILSRSLPPVTTTRGKLS